MEVDLLEEIELEAKFLCSNGMDSCWIKSIDNSRFRLTTECYWVYGLIKTLLTFIKIGFLFIF